MDFGAGAFSRFDPQFFYQTGSFDFVINRVTPLDRNMNPVQTTGYYKGSGTQFAFPGGYIAQIPEPETLALSLVGLMWFAIRKGRLA